MSNSVDTVKSFLSDVFDADGIHPEKIGDYFSPDAVFHDAMPGMEGVEGYKALMTMFNSATETVEGAIQPIIVGDGELVSIRWENKLKQTGDLLGVPATGRTFLAKGHETYRVKDGKIVENWAIMDIAGMMGQLTAE